MLEISKNEAMEMRKLLGDEEIHRSRSRHPKYYLVESVSNMAALEKSRKEKTVSVVHSH